MESTDKVLEGMKKAGVPMKAKEIAQATGMDEKEVAKAIKKLKAEGLIESPKVCYYKPAGS